MQNINVNIVPDSYPQTIRYSQGDVGREFKINVVGFTIPTGATVKIQATKPSGFGFSVAGTVSGNAVSFTTTAIMTDEAGRFPAELEITKDSVVIGTANFIMWGEANPHPEGTTDGQQGTIIPELTLLVERVEAAASSVLDMEVVANTLPAGSQATYSYDEDLNKATFGIPQGEAGAGAAGVVADAYSSSKTYKVGDYVLHNSNLYRCTTAITTAEAFTAAHWTQIVLANDVSDLKTDFNDITEQTRNLNNVDMGQYVVNQDGDLVVANNTYYGMSRYIPVQGGTLYTISFYGITSASSPIYLSVLQKKSGGTFTSAGYSNINTRAITTDTDTVGLAVYVHAGSEIILNNAHIQIDKGTQTPYIPPTSAKDISLREEITHEPIPTMGIIAPMLDTALEYFDKAYNDNLSPLIHEAGYGLFYTDVKDENQNYAIQCSEFVEALYKGIKWSNSRYTKNKNSMAQWAFISDGSEQTEQDGRPYTRSYYEGVNYPNAIDQSDYPSHDYMLASELYRYAVNHGFGYEITDIRSQIRPGDLLFYVDENEPNNYYKHISHVAIAVYVGYDNERVTMIESNNFRYGDNTNVGVGIGNIGIKYYKYGARFPIGLGQSFYKLLDSKSFDISGTTSAWKSYPLFDIYTYQPKKFYSIKIKGTFDPTKDIFLGVWFDGDAQITWKKITINGDTINGFFYAPKSFSRVYIGFNPSNTYVVDEATIYEGYFPE